MPLGLAGRVRARVVGVKTGHPPTSVWLLRSCPVCVCSSVKRRRSTASRSAGRAPAVARTHASTWLLGRIVRPASDTGGVVTTGSNPMFDDLYTRAGPTSSARYTAVPDGIGLTIDTIHGSVVLGPAIITLPTTLAVSEPLPS